MSEEMAGLQAGFGRLEILETPLVLHSNMVGETARWGNWICEKWVIIRLWLFRSTSQITST